MFLKQKFSNPKKLVLLCSITAVFMLHTQNKVALAGSAELLNKFQKSVEETGNKDDAFVIDENGTLIEYRGFTPHVTVPEGVKAIGGYAFSGHSEIKSIILPNSLQKISQYAFSACSSLLNLDIPDSVDSIEYYAFSGCTGLKHIRLGRGVDKIGEMALWYCPALKSIEVSPENTEFASYRGVLYNKNLDTVLKCPESFCGTFVAPSGIKAVSARAFSNCNKLTEIIFEDGVVNVGEAAFVGCTSLQRVYLGDSVRSIGICAFSGCSFLSEISLPSTTEYIGRSAFYNCKSLKIATIKSKNIKIDYHAFKYCGDHLQIYGYTESDVEAYAKSKDFVFVRIEE